MTRTGDLPEDLVEMYFKRVARKCALDHEDWSLLDIAMSEFQYTAHNKGTPWEVESPIGSYRIEVADYRLDRKNGYKCLPWPLIKLEDMRMVYDTKSACFISVEVTYNERGHRAIYGIRKDNGQPVLWAD